MISPAKTMTNVGKKKLAQPSEPRFMDHTAYIVQQMISYSPTEISEIFKVSAPIARALKGRFTSIVERDTPTLPAIDSYDGVVYKHIKQDREFGVQEEKYLQNHLRISSLLYGLLRPLDTIQPYRMEGFVRLASTDERIDHYWRSVQTQQLIEDVQSAGGTLLYLASKEEQNAFHWKEVTKAVRVIDFKFLQHKGDKLRQVVVYTKMARGEMICHMIDNNITNPELLKSFEWSGYQYNEELSSNDIWVWLME